VIQRVRIDLLSHSSSLPIPIQSPEAEDNENWSCTALCLRSSHSFRWSYVSSLALHVVECTLYLVLNPTLSAKLLKINRLM
jgi:hypothetical protein